jgi:GNAT superfamily N-acetyltransferase
VNARYPDLQVTGNPHASWEGALYPGKVSAMSTQLVSVLDREAQLKQMNATRAARVRKAQKVGFEVTIVERPTEADVPRFYPLYAAHASYWRYTRWVRDEAYFRALLRFGGQDLVLFLVHLDGELAGFRLLGRQGQTALGLHLATTPPHEKLDVGPLIIAETLAWCHANGVRTFDFMPSGPLHGVTAYKASFGGKPAPFLAATSQSWLGWGLRTAWHRLRATSEASLSTAASPS